MPAVWHGSSGISKRVALGRARGREWKGARLAWRREKGEGSKGEGQGAKEQGAKEQGGRGQGRRVEAEARSGAGDLGKEQADDRTQALNNGVQGLGREREVGDRVGNCVGGGRLRRQADRDGRPGIEKGRRRRGQRCCLRPCNQVESALRRRREMNSRGMFNRSRAVEQKKGCSTEAGC